MPLPINPKKGSAVEYVIRRMKGSSSFDDMKDYNENYNNHMTMRTEPEKNSKIGLEHAAEELLMSFEKKDKSSLLRSLRALISMINDEMEEEHEMNEKE